MTVKRVRVNYHNGKDFDTFHYETQAKQVKVVESDSDIEEILFKGKLLDGIDLDSVALTGVYRVKNGTNTPIESLGDTEYLFEVIAIGREDNKSVIKQSFYDHVNMNEYQRYIYDSTINEWSSAGKITIERIKNVEKRAELLENRVTETEKGISTNIKGITALNGRIDDTNKSLSTHNHDSRYLSLNGGVLESKVSIKNGQSFAGKNTSGSDLNLGKVNGVNDIVIGDKGAKSVLEAKSGDVSVSDGTKLYRLFHTGFQGHNSGLDADTVDGLHGSQIARTDATNFFKGNSYMEEGRSLYFRTSDDSSKTGNIYWRKQDNSNLTTLSVETNGEMRFQAGGITGFKVLPTGQTETTYDHILNSKNRQVAVRFKLDDDDKGAGLYMNNNSKQLGMYDWDKGSWYFTTDRAKQIVQFYNSVEIQGQRLSIQSSAPSGATNGDVWINI